MVCPRCSVRSLLTTGDLYGAEYAYHYVPDHEDLFDKEAFQQSATAFYVVCTDVMTGQPVYKRLDRVDYDCYEWIRASASMPLTSSSSVTTRHTSCRHGLPSLLRPLASRVVTVGGRRLLDGGVSDSIPLRYFQQEGYGRNVVVLTQPAGYVKRQNNLLPLIRLALRRYPAFIDAMRRRPEMYNGQLRFVADEERRGTAFVIRPPFDIPIGYTSHDPDAMQRVYDMGRDEAQRCLTRLEQFLI